MVVNSDVEDARHEREAYRKMFEIATNTGDKHLSEMTILVRRMAMKRFRSVGSCAAGVLFRTG